MSDLPTSQSKNGVFGSFLSFVEKGDLKAASIDFIGASIINGLDRDEAIRRVIERNSEISFQTPTSVENMVACAKSGPSPKIQKIGNALQRVLDIKTNPKLPLNRAKGNTSS